MARFLSILAFALAVFSAAAEAARKKPSPPPPPPFPFNTCPSSPLDKCDFYLSLYKSSIPTFKLSAIAQDKLLSSAVLTSKDGKLVVTASTTGSCFFIPETSATGKCGASFYFRGKTKKNGLSDVLRANMVAARTTINASLKNYNGKCIALPVATAQIQVKAPKGKALGSYLYLNPNTLLKEYPKGRRCVIIKTKV